MDVCGESRDISGQAVLKLARQADIPEPSARQIIDRIAEVAGRVRAVATAYPLRARSSELLRRAGIALPGAVNESGFIVVDGGRQGTRACPDRSSRSMRARVPRPRGVRQQPQRGPADPLGRARCRMAIDCPALSGGLAVWPEENPCPPITC